MRILIVHPVMTYLGGGERLCCETIRVLLSNGHEVTMLSEAFDQTKVERFFGYGELFDRADMALYPHTNAMGELGTTSHLIHHVRGQRRMLKELGSRGSSFDLIFSTQDAGYIPNMGLPVIQWGYFPKVFPRFFNSHSGDTLIRSLRWLPLRLYYEREISRIGLVLAISRYSKLNLDKEWRRPSTIVYPACHTVVPGVKRNLVVTVARSIPAKNLELFWEVARLRPQYEFFMLLTKDRKFEDYSLRLSKASPSNGRTIFNPSKEMYHAILGQAKVYLHLMRGEHFGITIVEAMSAACVPIVHDSGGPQEIVENGVGFRWRNVEDIPAMVDEAMDKSPSLEARRRALDFSVERFEVSLSSVFSELRL